MLGMFKVTYFDPVQSAPNMEAFNVMAINAAHAIRVADKKKTLKKYRPENVELIAWVDA